MTTRIKSKFQSANYPPMNSQAITTALAILAMASPAFADPNMLFNRGLPTANLNTGDANQSNVAWADTESSTTPSEYWLPGDNFTLSGAGNYAVNDIRVWEVGPPTDGLSLWGGLDSGSIFGQISSSYSVTPVTYANGSSYQGNYGDYWQIYQLDFSVNLSLASGQTYDFFLDGPYTTYSDTEYANAFLSASNAALSGSTQQGADNQFLWLDVSPTATIVQTWFSGPPGGGTTEWGAEWDKDSDANVQVFGTSVPDFASTWMLLCAGLAGLGIIRRKLRS